MFLMLTFQASEEYLLTLPDCTFPARVYTRRALAQESRPAAEGGSTPSKAPARRGFCSRDKTRRMWQEKY